MENIEKVVVGISLGDINGVGIEVILKTFDDARILDFCTPVLFGSTRVVSYHKKAINSEVNIHGIKTIDQLLDNKVNLLNIWNEDVNIDLGTPTEISGNYAAKSLEAAVESLNKNEIDILLTAPINKENIQSKNFNFPGHTEFLQAKLEGQSLMILMTEELKVGLVTGHIPVSKVAETITPELIKNKVEILHKSLQQDFGISRPKIALLGLNPHCGDKGVIGKEDDETIRPTIAALFEEGKLVFGPYAADGFFGASEYKKFDAVLAMYHDQGLAPFKTLSFGKGVNFTAGLNKIRTSPDHGTAFEIAGKGIAEETSFKEALFAGIKIFKNREDYNELTQNKLKTKR